MTFLVTTPNPDFSGKTCGIQFNKGKAMVNAAVLDKSLGLNCKEVVARMRRDFGYDARLLDGKGAEAGKE